MHRLWLILLLLLTSLLAVQAQDGLNLPTELYVLYNDGGLERYGLGAAGVQPVLDDSGDFIIDFAIAPDDNWIAYRSENGLMLDHMYLPDFEPVQLDPPELADVPPLRGQGDSMAWSPQGDAIAYTTFGGARVTFTNGMFTNIFTSVLHHLSWSPGGNYLAAESNDNIWWIYRRDGTEFPLTSAIPAATGIDWLSDTQLVFGPAEGGLVIMDLANANAQTPLLDNSWVCGLPQVEGPGSVLAFCRRSNDTTTAENSGRLTRITFDQNGVSTEDLSPQTLEFGNVRWAKGGVLLISFEGGTLILIEPRTVQGFNPGITGAVAYSWGAFRPEQVESVRLPRDGYFLAPDLMGVVQVWSQPANGDLPLTVTPSTSDITSFAVAPNGQQIAYVSEGTLWLHVPGSESEPTALVELPDIIHDLVFSPNGQTLAYTDPFTEEGPTGGIWTVGVNGGEPELILENGDGAEGDVRPPFYRKPQFAPNINALLVYAGGSETTNILAIDLNTQERFEIGQADGAFWLGDGRIVTYGTGIGIGDPQPAAIRVVDIQTPDEEPVILYTVPADFIMDDLRQTSTSALRLITHPQAVGPVQLTLTEIPLSGGDGIALGEIDYIADPMWTLDGTAIVGTNHPQGLLLVHTLQSAGRVLLRAPSGIEAFTWR